MEKSNSIKSYEKEHLKRKKGESIRFDIYINKVNQIKIEKLNGQSKMAIIEDNKIIFILPAYMRKKKYNRYNNLIIDTSLSKFSLLNSCERNKKKINASTQTNNISISNNNNLFPGKDNNEINSSEEYISEEINNEINENNQNLDLEINADFLNIVKTLNPINMNDIKIIKIIGDGNCFYRCLSFFLLGNDDFFQDIKNEIINWIDNNRETFNDFFGDDDINNISKEEFANEEYNYIKSKDSWGGFHTIEIACILFGISIGVYTENGNNELIRYSYSENLKGGNKLMLLSYHNNNHFDLIYDKKFKLENSNIIKNIKDIKIENKVSKLNINYQGNIFKNSYVKTKFKGSDSFYDEISNFLKSKQKYENAINLQKEKHPNWHENQILALFNLKYPDRMCDKSLASIEKRKIFRKELKNYKLDNNNRLLVINPLNRIDEKETLYKIPYIHEKEIIIMQTHYNNNHCGRINVINELHKEKWYWYGMNNDVANTIKLCKFCDKPNKFKSLTKKIKIILDNGPHYRYVADLWYLNQDIRDITDYNYVLDIIDHFSKWYYGYLLKTKEAEEVLKKIDTYMENFGKCKILQVDNGTEFKNKELERYCHENNIKLVHSSPYHPQSNGVCEVVHKEIRKYIYTEFFKDKINFNIEDELFNIIKIHNNKIHSSTKRIPKDIRDIEDIEEIKEINEQIIKTLSKKNKNYDLIDFTKKYVIDYNKLYINKDKILRKKGKFKKPKKIIKLPIEIISEYDEDFIEFIIVIKKAFKEFEDNKSYIISTENIEEVEENLWNELLK